MTNDSTPIRGNDYYVARQDARESSARTYARKLKLAIAKAEGITITDTDGRVFYDCLAGAGVLATGHNHPKVVEAVRRQLDTGLPFSTLDIATPVKDAYVNAIFDSLPSEFANRAKIQFCGPTGADAIEAAIKLVKTATERSTMLAFRGGYHGMTNATLGLSGNLGPKRTLPGVASDTQFLAYPYQYRCPFGIGGEGGLKANINSIRTLLHDPESGVIPAGILLEAVQGEGGVIPADNGWMQQLRALTTEYKLPLIVDEVQTGWGRTGRLYAFEHSGIQPDVLVLSKAIGGGLPMSVVIYDQDLDVWKPGAHAGTFRGNQLAMAAGLATLEVIRTEGLVENSEQMGARLMDRLRAIQSDVGIIGDVRGRGLMIGVEIVDPNGHPDLLGNPPQDAALAVAIQQNCLARGLIIELGGRFGAVVRFLPPLIITAEQVDAICDIFHDAARAAVAERKLPLAS